MAQSLKSALQWDQITKRKKPRFRRKVFIHVFDLLWNLYRVNLNENYAYIYYASTYSCGRCYCETHRIVFWIISSKPTDRIDVELHRNRPIKTFNVQAISSFKHRWSCLNSQWFNLNEHLKSTKKIILQRNSQFKQKIQANLHRFIALSVYC